MNDGAELDRTLKDLGELGNSLESISVVPVGLSDHRKNLQPLTGFNKESAKAVVKQVRSWQEKFLESHGTRLVYLSDEFYLMAQMPLPPYEEYEGFPQIENGVGLCASLKYEFEEALFSTKRRKPKRKKTIATGKSAVKLMEELTAQLKGDRLQVIPMENRFFGEAITVTGLITGQDLITQLKDRELGEEVLISSAMLRHDDDVFLDDTTVSQVQEALGVPVTVVPNDGFALLKALLK